MANLNRYVGFYCPCYNSTQTIPWSDIYEAQADLADSTSNLNLVMYEIKAESVPEARRKLFSLLYRFWDEIFTPATANQILINVMDMDDPDNFEEEYIELFGNKDGSKMAIIVNENYDNFGDNWDYFDDMTDNSQKIFMELSEKTKMELYYDAIHIDLMIYPLNKG